MALLNETVLRPEGEMHKTKYILGAGLNRQLSWPKIEPKPYFFEPCVPLFLMSQ
jgi:hypothetical protein